jgi:hypothetical protein
VIHVTQRACRTEVQSNRVAALVARGVLAIAEVTAKFARTNIGVTGREQ